MSTQRNIISHGIRDSHTRGKVADFLAEKMAAGSQFSVVSANFTIYATTRCPVSSTRSII